MVIELRGREKGGAESDSSDKKEKLNEVSEKTEGERERERERGRESIRRITQEEKQKHFRGREWVETAD